MSDDTLGFGEQIILKIIGNFPSNDFDFSPYIADLRSLLGQINYFIPFYLLADITSAWVGIIFILMAGIAFYKLAIKFGK